MSFSRYWKCKKCSSYAQYTSCHPRGMEMYSGEDPPAAESLTDGLYTCVEMVAFRIMNA